MGKHLIHKMLTCTQKFLSLDSVVPYFCQVINGKWADMQCPDQKVVGRVEHTPVNDEDKHNDDLENRNCNILCYQ